MLKLRALLGSGVDDIITAPDAGTSSATNSLSVENITNVDSVSDGGKLNPFSKLVDEYGGGAYNILFKIIIWVVILALLVAAGKVAFSSSDNRKFIKNDIVARILAVLLACGTLGGVAYLQSIGISLFNLI